MVKRQSSSQTRSPSYKQLLNDARDEYLAWLESFIESTEHRKYCIRCSKRKTVSGRNFCKHCLNDFEEARKIERVKSRKTKDTRKKPPKLKLCNEPGCLEKYHAKGKCKKHYNTMIKRVIRAKKSLQRNQKKGNVSAR